jgi:hypothetical protein
MDYLKEIMRIIILVLLMCCVPLCFADGRSSLLPQAKAAFERDIPKRHFQENTTVFGDINGDGISDFVTFVGAPEYTDKSVEDLKIAVFLGGPNDTFSFFGTSSELLGHEKVVHELGIGGQSIYLRRKGPEGCCYHWTEDFQFKMRNGRLELIGVELRMYHLEGNSGHDSGSSANVLTGAVIKWSGNGKDKQVRKMIMRQLKPVPFKEFNYDSFSEQWFDALT